MDETTVGLSAAEIYSMCTMFYRRLPPECRVELKRRLRRVDDEILRRPAMPVLILDHERRSDTGGASSSDLIRTSSPVSRDKAPRRSTPEGVPGSSGSTPRCGRLCQFCRTDPIGKCCCSSGHTPWLPSAMRRSLPSLAAIKKSAPVPTYKNGEPKVKWHSKKRPWRIQITGMVCFFGFYFCFVKTLFSFSFCQTKKYSEPTLELAKLRLDVLKTVAFEKTTSSNILFPLLSGQVIHPRLEALVEDIAVLPPGLAFLLTFFVASTAHRTSLAGLVSPFVPGLAFLTCFFAFTAHLTCLDRWGIRSSPFGAVRSRPCFF